MYFCEPCRKENNWPTSLMRSRGQCEICDYTAVCYSVPLYRLPPVEFNEKRWNDGISEIATQLQERINRL